MKPSRSFGIAAGCLRLCCFFVRFFPRCGILWRRFGFNKCEQSSLAKNTRLRSWRRKILKYLAIPKMCDGFACFEYFALRPQIRLDGLWNEIYEIILRKVRPELRSELLWQGRTFNAITFRTFLFRCINISELTNSIELFRSIHKNQSCSGYKTVVCTN